MKKFYFFVVAALMGVSSMQAQTTIATLGFEDGDATGKSSQYALTPGLSAFGDWVNVKDVDARENAGDFRLHGIVNRRTACNRRKRNVGFERKLVFRNQADGKQERIAFKVLFRTGNGTAFFVYRSNGNALDAFFPADFRYSVT